MPCLLPGVAIKKPAKAGVAMKKPAKAASSPALPVMKKPAKAAKADEMESGHQEGELRDLMKAAATVHTHPSHNI